MDQANLITLHSSTLKISYSCSSFDGKPLLNYQKGTDTPLTFRGSQLRQKQTEIGQLVFVTLKNVPDSRSIVFSLLLPQINVNAGQDVVIKVKGIETTSRTSIAGPNLVKGQVQTYKVYALTGKASYVQF